MAKPGAADNRILPAPGSPSATAPRVLWILLMGCGIGAVFGSVPLAQWAQALPDGQAGVTVQAAAQDWTDAMARIGADRPYRWVHGMIQAVIPAH